MNWNIWFPINKICPICGFQTAYSNYCYRDGTKMIKHKKTKNICQKCKEILSPLDKFCGNCGKKRNNL